MKNITILALHLNYGGIEKYISYLCKMFENDYAVEVISTYKHDELPAFEFSDKINIRYLINDYPDRISIKRLIKSHNYFLVIKELFRRIKLKYLVYCLNIKSIKNISADYVITTRIFHNKLVNKYLKKSNIVKIATEHNYHNNNEKYINKLINSVTNFDYFVHCTDELYNFYKTKIIGPKNVKIYHPVYINNNYKSKLNNLNIVSVGRLSEEKGYLDLIEVMREITKINPNINLTICGDGYLREAIKNKIEEYKLINNIHLPGFLKDKELAKVYIESSLYVMSSISESFGLVLLEAMHYGLPCIAFDSASGVRELLKNDTGILIKNRNIKEMALKIIELLDNQKLLKEYSRKSLACVKNYSLDKIYNEWQQIFK
ncbi:MAG: glycosyltransferase [Bacilli bacterium]